MRVAGRHVTCDVPPGGGRRCGDHGPDRYDEGALAKAMRDVLTNSELRHSLIRRGLERVQLFSNRRMAEGTLAVYEEVLSSLRPASFASRRG